MLLTPYMLYTFLKGIVQAVTHVVCDVKFIRYFVSYTTVSKPFHIFSFFSENSLLWIVILKIKIKKKILQK